VHASCWSTAKMNRSKKAFFVRARSIATNESTSSAKQSHNMMPCGAFFGTSPQPRKDKKKETTIKMDFSFVGVRAPFLQSQRKMMAHNAVARAPQCLVAHTVGTRHNNPKDADIPRKEKETTIKMDFSLVLGRGRHFPEPKKDDRARRCGKGASSVHQRARE